MSDLENEIEGIFSAFEMASERNTKRSKISQLKTHNIDLKSKCGTCFHWMKSSECPNERPSNKVTCNGRICDKFKIVDWATKLINKNELEIYQLENELNPNP